MRAEVVDDAVAALGAVDHRRVEPARPPGKCECPDECDRLAAVAVGVREVLDGEGDVGAALAAPGCCGCRPARRNGTTKPRPCQMRVITPRPTHASPDSSPTEKRRWSCGWSRSKSVPRARRKIELMRAPGCRARQGARGRPVRPGRRGAAQRAGGRRAGQGGSTTAATASREAAATGGPTRHGPSPTASTRGRQVADARAPSARSGVMPRSHHSRSRSKDQAVAHPMSGRNTRRSAIASEAAPARLGSRSR